jgi:hypothetical protein
MLDRSPVIRLNTISSPRWRRAKSRCSDSPSLLPLIQQFNALVYITVNDIQRDVEHVVVDQSAPAVVAAELTSTTQCANSRIANASTSVDGTCSDSLDLLLHCIHASSRRLLWVERLPRRSISVGIEGFDFGGGRVTV